jgi:hypothetical protein
MCHLELSTDLKIGHPPILRLSDRQHHTVVIGRLLLLCVLHRIDLICEHHYNTYRHEEGKTASTSGMIGILIHFAYTDHRSGARIVPLFMSRERLC